MRVIIFQHYQQTKTSLTHLIVIESVVGHPVKIEAVCNWLESKQITLNWSACFYKRSHENTTVMNIYQCLLRGTKLPNGGSESNLINSAVITSKIRSVDCCFPGMKLMSTWDRPDLGWGSSDWMQMSVFEFLLQSQKSSYDSQRRLGNNSPPPEIGVQNSPTKAHLENTDVSTLTAKNSSEWAALMETLRV